MSRDLQALKEITEKQLRDPTEIRSPDPELWRCSLEGTLNGPGYNLVGGTTRGGRSQCIGLFCQSLS